MNIKITILSLGLLAVSACQKTPVKIEYANVCQPENNGKYIETSGYFGAGQLAICRDRKGTNKVACLMELRETADAESGFGAYIDEGGAANQIEELKKDFQLEDIKIRTADNVIVSLDERVKARGQLEINPLKSAPEKSSCILTIEKIEKQ